MAKVADLREQILLEVYLMGFRIGDVALLEWRKFDQNGEPSSLLCFSLLLNRFSNGMQT